jgi:agmatine deiminase
MRDSETNVVYVTDALGRYPAVLGAIKHALEYMEVECRPLCSTKNIWCRDYMPAQVNEYFVKFNYKGYGDPATVASGLSYSQYPQLAVPRSCWENLGWVVEADLIVDCGNIVRYGDRALMTEIVYQHNPGTPPGIIRQRLSELLQAEIIFIPPEPGDDLGHTDGIVKWIDDRNCFLNDYRVMRDAAYRDYTTCVRSILKASGIEAVPFPYAYNRCPAVDEADFRKRYPDADEINPGWGYYINYLQVKGGILYPTFDIDDDERVEACLWDAFPDLELFAIDCSDLSMEGGLVNCTTMNYCL